MLEKWKDKFIEDCKQWWKLWSTWLAAFWAMIVTAFWNDPAIFKEILDQLPDETRAWLSPLVFALVGGLPVLVRLLKQNKLIEAMQEKLDEN